MLLLLATVLEDVHVHTARFFQSIRKNLQSVIAPFLANRQGQSSHKIVIPRQPCVIYGNGVKGITKDLSEQRASSLHLGGPGGLDDLSVPPLDHYAIRVHK